MMEPHKGRNHIIWCSTEHLPHILGVASINFANVGGPPKPPEREEEGRPVGRGELGIEVCRKTVAPGRGGSRVSWLN